jgi:hypothetical protein
MTASNHLQTIFLIVALVGCGMWVRGEDAVTVVATSSDTSATAKKKPIVADDTTPVVHKSVHKKKKTSSSETAAATGSTGTRSGPTVADSAQSRPPQKEKIPPVIPPTTIESPVVVSVTRSAPAVTNAASLPAALTTPVSRNPSTLVPTVETGLPVPRYPGMGTPIKGVSTYVPASIMGSTAHQSYLASAYPATVIPMTSSAAGSFSSVPSTTITPSSDFVFTNFTKRTKNSYPWRTGIVTTMFWIGEGGSAVSSTDNVASAWDEDWRSKNRGNDSPNDRNGFATAEHASTVNPFYVALPFNDLAFPDKAHEWLPAGWYRRPQDGKQVSACKDRWVWIKNAQGRSCFAQWEDVGPLTYSDAEYVFGGHRPTGMGDYRAGLDISPAVAQYLGIDENHKAITSWRFVDDEDVPPGAWLKYDEQAVIYTALHQLKSSKTSVIPVQKATEPVEDPDSVKANKKKVDASKG